MTDERTDEEQIADLREHGEGLTAWEVEFLGDLEIKIGAGRALTDKQRAKVAQIYQDRMKGAS